MQLAHINTLAIFDRSSRESWAFPKAHLVRIAMKKESDGWNVELKFPIRTVALSGLPAGQSKLEAELLSDGHTLCRAAELAEDHAQNDKTPIIVKTIDTFP